ncbi:MAG: DNA cytosine methyltransferase [Kiritimatiellae bacterium]|nr:DNA cytosine methyltransferase [Kiritimatiellia bacterium]
MKALSLFSNVGIAETYLEECGVEVVVANELLEQRARFYHHLYPSTDMVNGDITDSSTYAAVIKKARKEKVDIIIATPPCQGMSIAGEMNPYDERNSLVKYAIDAVLDLRPAFVLLENVPEQLVTPIFYKGRELLIPDYINERIGRYYDINDNQLLNTMDYGVPQMRRRAIFLCTVKGSKTKWEFPRKSRRIVTLKEAFAGIPSIWPNVREQEFKGRLPGNSKDALSYHVRHQPMTHVWRNIECMLYTPTGNTAFDNPVYYPKKKDGKRIKGYNTTYHRMFWDKPGSTITTFNFRIGSQNNVHPGSPWMEDRHGDMMYSDPRVLTILELLIVSSLPTNWDIPQWASDNLIRTVIGEGIPPLLVKKIIMNMPK